MKGLILKDFCNAKAFSKQYLIILIIMAACAFGTKNLAFLTIYIVILGGMQCITTMNIDENCGFNKICNDDADWSQEACGCKVFVFLILSWDRMAGCNCAKHACCPFSERRYGRVCNA